MNTIVGTIIEKPSELRESCSVRRTTEILKKFRIIGSKNERRDLLDQLAAVHKPFVVSFVNAHALNILWKCPLFCQSIHRSDIVLRDGIGVRLLMNALGLCTGINMNGTDFIPEIAERFSGRRVALCGTQEPYLSLAAEKLKQLGAEVVLAKHGFAPIEDYLPEVTAAKPDLVILGMGMPKQEKLSMQLAASLDYPVVIVNGGAIIDFWAERFPRAPMLMRKLRLEWLFRMMLEPRRLWRRYILGGMEFLGHILQLKLLGNVKQNA